MVLVGEGGADLLRARLKIIAYAVTVETKTHPISRKIRPPFCNAL